LIAGAAGGMTLSAHCRSARAQAAPTTAPSPATALDFLKTKAAAETGDVAAQYKLSQMYYLGQGVAKSLPESVNWARKAAERGHADAMYALGCAYYDGEGVARNLPEAVRWFREGAKRGSLESQYNLAVMTENGDGVPTNLQEAVGLYTKAANAGLASAQAALGGLYINGRGVPKDLEKARFWLAKAAAQGDENGRKWLSELAETEPQTAQVDSTATISDDEVIAALRAHLKHHAIKESCNASTATGDVFAECFKRYGTVNPRALALCKAELAKENASDCERAKRMPASEFGTKSVFSVVSKKNYEGIFVAYVNARTKGTDQLAKVKLRLARRGNGWTVIEIDDVKE
jgi:TPR repeat protein